MRHAASLPPARPVASPGRAVALLLGAAAALAPAAAAGQAHGQARPPTPVVLVLPFAVADAPAGDDGAAIGQGIAALLHAELAARSGVRVAGGAGARPAGAAGDGGASHTVAGEVALAGDSVRVVGWVRRSEDGVSLALDTLAARSDEIPMLVEELADVVADSVAQGRETTRGGGPPIFRPPRPPVPFAAMSLYSRAVAARKAGDADTAARLLRQVVTAAPRWEQPKRELAALRRP